MGIYISAGTSPEAHKDMGSTIGRVEPTIEASFFQECGMEEAAGI